MKYRFKQYLGLLLVVVVGLALTACGSNKSDDVKVSCKDVSTQLVAAQSKLDNANAELKKVSGTPAEKSVKQDVTKAKATVNALNDCDDSKQASDTKCPTTWVMNKTSPSNGDIVEDVPSIRNAKSKADARAAANDWVDLVKDNPGTLKGAASVVLEKDVKQKGLVDANGCATSRAKGLVEQMKVALALSDISPDQAPANGYNSGAIPATGQVYTYSKPGVTGNLVAVKVKLRNGHTMWVMARCGNIVTLHPSPHLPQPKPHPTPYCKTHPPAPKCLTPKDPTKDVLVNPNVPDQVKGHGTTPVGTSPGPATKPVDSSTGCDGPCPVPTSSPSPTSPTTPPPDTTPVVTQPPATGTPPPPPSD